MAAVLSQHIDYPKLILEDRIHGSLYTSPAIFDDEMQRIYYQGWVYVGHESEVPEAGDFVVKQIGLQSVVLTRSEEGVHVLYNKCSHRGNSVCVTEKGHVKQLQCAYHGWSFNMKGELAGVPFPNGYKDDFDYGQSGMATVARQESYQGFVFASLVDQGISLMEHLGHGREMIDMLVGLSPEGKLDLNAGWMKHRFTGNWKMIVENQVDGYHAAFTHGSLLRANRTFATVRDRKDTSPAHARDLGMGHSDIDHASDYLSKDKPFRWSGGVDPDRLPGYVAAMKKSYGDQEAHRRMVMGPPHAMIFPNLFLAEMAIMIVQPVSAGETLHLTTPIVLKGGAELNERSLRRGEGALGPAGFLIADDAEISEHTQRGLAASKPEWLILARGLHTEVQNADGTRTAGLMDETSQRGFWRHYRDIMGEQA